MSCFLEAVVEVMDEGGRHRGAQLKAIPDKPGHVRIHIAGRGEDGVLVNTEDLRNWWHGVEWVIAAAEQQ